MKILQKLGSKIGINDDLRSTLKTKKHFLKKTFENCCKNANIPMSLHMESDISFITLFFCKTCLVARLSGKGIVQCYK